METLAAAAAAAFVLSAIDYWRRLGFLRGLIALLAAAAALAALGTWDWTLLALSPAAAFLAMTASALVDWVLDHAPVRRIR